MNNKNIKKSLINGVPYKRKLSDLKYCISIDYYNLLQGKENIIIYKLKKLFYKLELYFRNYKL